jgi:hypothetical protein
LGPARAGTNTPEKQADITTTVGRSPQASPIIRAAPTGVSSRSPTTAPSGVPWEVK